MHIEISYQNINHSDAVDEHVREQLADRLGRFGERLTRIEVHLGDVNGHKSGPDDKRCMIEARPARHDPLVVESHHSDLYHAISDATHKIERVLDKKFAKDSHH